MICPECGLNQERVVDSREAQQGHIVRRRRECVCAHRWTTFELDADSLVGVAESVGQALKSIKNIAAGLRAGKNRWKKRRLQMEQPVNSEI